MAKYPQIDDCQGVWKMKEVSDANKNGRWRNVGSRAVLAIGTTIDYITMATEGDASDFGDTSADVNSRVGLGSHTNNRQGISFNAEHSFGNLKINGGLGVFAEIDTSYASLTYSYNVNAQTLSRFNIFRRNWGPYNSLNSIFRRVFEDVSIIDASSTEKASFKKFFNTLEFQAKYKNKIGSHNFYIFSLSRLNSRQKDIKALPQYNLNPTTLISQFSQEFDFSLELNPSTTFIFSYGIERIIGNSLTGIGDQDISLGGNTINNLLENLGFDRFTEKNFSKNQQNRLFGIGLDYKIAKNAMLFIRHNWYKYYDPNFVLNNLRGTETMLEIKILF